jgi:hypothetical protein
MQETIVADTTPVRTSMNRMGASPAPAWPPLPLAQWEDTHAALHRWMQVIGKLRMASLPWTNHSWHVALALTARGIGSGPLPCGGRFWQADFDFLADRLEITCSDGAAAQVPLQPQSVARFHAAVRDALASMDIPCDIRTMPAEIAEAVPFEQDTHPRPYDAEAVRRWWRVLLQAERVLRIFRARFRGKCSPVHFFWGAMDLAVTRFSGRTAPPHPGGAPHLADWVMREAYSHEVSSCGFWAGPGRSGVLRVRLSRASRVRELARAAPRCLLQRCAARVHPPLRPRERGCGPRCRAAGVPAVHVRSCRAARWLAARGAGVRVAVVHAGVPRPQADTGGPGFSR